MSLNNVHKSTTAVSRVLALGAKQWLECLFHGSHRSSISDQHREPFMTPALNRHCSCTYSKIVWH